MSEKLEPPLDFVTDDGRLKFGAQIATSPPHGAIPAIACNLSLQRSSRSPISMTDTDKTLEVSESWRDARRNHPRQGEFRGLDAYRARVIVGLR